MDLHNMPSRGKTLPQEVIDHISECERFIAVVGRHWLASPVCQTERDFAIEIGQVINPVVRSEELSFEQLPADLKKFLVVNFQPNQNHKRAMRELLRVIAEPAALPWAARYLREGLSLATLERIAARRSDTEAAQQMQQAKQWLFQQFSTGRARTVEVNPEPTNSGGNDGCGKPKKRGFPQPWKSLRDSHIFTARLLLYLFKTLPRKEPSSPPAPSPFRLILRLEKTAFFIFHPAKSQRPVKRPDLPAGSIIQNCARLRALYEHLGRTQRTPFTRGIE